MKIKTQDIGTAMGLFAFMGLLILLSPLIILLTVFTAIDNYRAVREVKRNFISQNEGKLFFCYTNKKKTENIVEEHLIPALPAHTGIIKLEGKEPVSDYPNKYISHILYRIKEIGFPNIMLIRDRKIWDVSMKKEFYNSINQGRENFSEIIDNSLKKIKAKAEQVDAGQPD